MSNSRHGAVACETYAPNAFIPACFLKIQFQHIINFISFPVEFVELELNFARTKESSETSKKQSFEMHSFRKNCLLFKIHQVLSLIGSYWCVFRLCTFSKRSLNICFMQFTPLLAESVIPSFVGKMMMMCIIEFIGAFLVCADFS